MRPEFYKPAAEGTLENPVKSGAEGARPKVETLRQKDRADHKTYLHAFFRVA